MKPIRTPRWAALALAAALVGCDNASAPSSAPATPPGSTTSPGPAAPAKPAETKSAEAAPAKKFDFAGAKLSEKELTNINKLDEADRKLALEQKLCAVQGSHLGGMGKPYKVVLDGKTVFLCCDGCEEEAKEHPAETLAKLGR